MPSAIAFRATATAVGTVSQEITVSSLVVSGKLGRRLGGSQTEFIVVRTIKGHAPAAVIAISPVFDSARADLSNREVVAFLQGPPDSYQLMRPFSFLPAPSELPPAKDTPLSELASELATVVESGELPPAEEASAVLALTQIADPIAIAALEREAASSEPAIKAAAVTGLAFRGDPAGLQIAADYAFDNPSDLQFAEHLADSLRWMAVGPSAGLPQLQRLVAAPQPAVRAAALAALERSSPSSSPAFLGRALSDPDSGVRKAAMAGLAKLFAQPQWDPGLNRGWEQRSDKFVEHWQQWCKEHGIPTK